MFLSAILKTADASKRRVGWKMKTSVKIALLIVIALSVALVVLQSGLLYTPVALDQREDRTVCSSNENVVIDVSIFSGKIEIQPTTDDQIELIYTIKAPPGELSTIITQTDETKNEDQTTIITRANDNIKYVAPNHSADLLIKLPLDSQYNLTLLSGNGDITLSKLNLNKVRASTTQGNINIESSDSTTSIEALSMNGGIRIALAKDTLFYVAATVVGTGSIEYFGIDLDTEIATQTRLKASTSAGEGNLILTLMSTNDKITIEYLT